MQGVRSDLGGLVSCTARSDLTGVAKAVRLLTAAVLLGAALVIVALVGQGVAAARTLAAPPAPALAWARGAPLHTPARVDGHVDPYLFESLTAAAGVLRQPLPPSPQADAGSPQDRNRSDAPGPGARMVAANADWGLGWRGEEQGETLTVAAADAQPTSPEVGALLGDITYD